MTVQTLHLLVCDRCNASSRPSRLLWDMIRRCESEGWLHTNDETNCPACVDAALMALAESARGA